MIGAALLLASQQVTSMIPVELVVDPEHQLVEGVASDGRTIWVSSVIDRKIMVCPPPRRNKQRSCRTLTVLPRTLHPLGITWDSARKRLWVATDCPPLPGIAKCDRGALVALNASGKLMTRIGPPSGGFHPGDVSAAPAGVFVSDSLNGAVYRVGAAGATLEPVVAIGTGKSAQGSALDASGQQLLVSDYSQGIGVVDLASGNRKLLPRQDGKPLRGVDGVTRCGSTYFGIYNGSDNGALLSITTAADGLTFKQAIDSGLRDPTQIAFDGKRLLVVGDSGWASVDKPGYKRSEGAVILAIPLTADCIPDLG